MYKKPISPSPLSCYFSYVITNIAIIYLPDGSFTHVIAKNDSFVDRKVVLAYGGIQL